MHRYWSIIRCLPVCAVALGAAACAVPSAQDNVAVAAELVRSQSRAILEWRRDSGADAAARTRAAALLNDGVTLDEAVGVSFLTNPGVQVALEQLAISRAELVAAVTPPNPIAIIGARKPGGDLAAFYPEQSVSVGVLQNIIALLNIPDRTAIARHDLERVRYETAQLAVSHATQVVEAWLEYSAALQVEQFNTRGVAAASAAVDALAVRAANDASVEPLLIEARGYEVRAVDDATHSELDATTARARLGELMGVTGWRDDWQLLMHLPPAPAADPDPVAIEAAAMLRRLDLLAAGKAVDMRLRALATQRRFRWLNQLELGVSRDMAIGGTSFTGPNAVVELPLFDQRRAVLLQSDAELRADVRRLEAARIAARTEIRVRAAELRAIRQQLQRYERSILPAARQQLLADAGVGVDPAAPERLNQRQSALADEAAYVGVLREYWRTRSALAMAAGDWAAISGL